MSTLIRLITAALLVASLSACSIFEGKPKADDPTPLEDFDTSLRLTKYWERDTGADLEDAYLKLTPAVYEEQVFVTSPEGEILVFSLENGRQIWERDIERPISSGPGIGDGMVVVGDSDGQVTALSLEDGVELWRTQVTSEVLSAPVVANDIVVVRTVDGKLTGLSSEDGSQIWIYERDVPPLTLRGASEPAVHRGSVIAGFDNGRVAALELSTGKVIWEVPIAQPTGRTELERVVDIDGKFKIDGSDLFITTFQGQAVVMDADNGNLIWNREISSYAGLDADSRGVYVSDEDSSVWAFDRYSGTSLWKQDKLKFRQLTAPVIVGSYVVVGDLEGYLHWLNRENGEFVARYETGADGIRTVPITVGNRLICFDNDGQLTVIGPAIADEE